MRLLTTDTLQFRTFLDANIPRYAILSHTWGSQEVTYQDIEQQRDFKHKTGWSKITNFARTAIFGGYEYIWVDTCCIDKSSSAELSEAINSMFRWYEKSAECYVYLDDVENVNIKNKGKALEKLQRCRWFTRGWTLQELLAPGNLIFFDSKWAIIGRIFASSWNFNDNDFFEILARITGIPAECIQAKKTALEQSVSCKMSWAARRATTRLEDEAYCLLGLFGVNMPLLYGEGRRAFRRLQEEILKESEDYTLLAFDNHHPTPHDGWIDLASRPSDFLHYADYIAGEWERLEELLRPEQPFAPWAMTS